MSHTPALVLFCFTLGACANGGGPTWSSGMNDRDMFTLSDLGPRDGSPMDMPGDSLIATDFGSDEFGAIDSSSPVEMGSDLGMDMGVDMGAPIDAGMSCSGSLDCSDGNPCNGEEECVAHRCLSGIAPTCDDFNVCTDDACDPSIGCVNTGVPDEALRACDDGLGCTIADRCISGSCSGRARRCLSGCVCSEPTGLCVGEACELEPIE